jgi:hypothetical protein
MAGRGRPSKAKKVETKKEVVAETKQEQAIDFEKILEQALAKQEEKLRKEFEDKLQETKIQEKTIVVEKKSKEKLSVRGRRFIPDDAIIRVDLNIGGKFIMADNRGGGYFVEWNGYKNSRTVKFGDLKNFHGQKHTFLNSGKIIITDIISDTDVCLEDAIEDLNLQKLYNDETIIRPFEIEHYLSDEVGIHEFSKKMEKSLDYKEVIIEVAMILFKEGKFSDNSKMNKLREVTRNPELFTK